MFKPILTWVFISVLAVVWLILWVTAHTLGGIIHFLLFFAVVLAVQVWVRSYNERRRSR